MNGYELTRAWYNYKFDNVDKVRHVHSDLYFYMVDLWNRLGQTEKFGLPTSVTMQSLGIGSYNTYKKTLNDLIDFGFVILVQESKNQHQSKIVALSIIDKATDKALDKALVKATDTIIELLTIEQGKDICGTPLELPLDSPRIVKPKKVTPSTSVHHKVINLFFTEMHPEFVFSPVHGKQVKELIQKTKKLFDKKNRDITDDSVFDFIKMFFMNLPEWHKTKDLQTINSKFNEIVEELKKTKNGQTSNSTKPISKYAPTR